MKKRKCRPFRGVFSDSHYDHALALLHVRDRKLLVAAGPRAARRSVSRYDVELMPLCHTDADVPRGVMRDPRGPRWKSPMDQMRLRLRLRGRAPGGRGGLGASRKSRRACASNHPSLRPGPGAVVGERKLWLKQL